MFFDFTPYIKLSQKERLAYSAIRIFTLIIFGLVLAYFFLTLILPRIVFSFNIKNTDPLYDLTDPIFDATSETVQFRASLLEEADTVTLIIKSDEDLDGKNVQLFKSYASFLRTFEAPQKESTLSEKVKSDTVTSLPYLSGDLIRSTKEYFVVDGTSLRTISSGDIVTAFGYDFDDADDSTSEDRSLYSKGKSLQMRSLHPEGTQFYDEDRDVYAVLKNGKLIETTPTYDRPIIAAQYASRSTKAECTLKSNLLPGAFSCNFRLEAIKPFSGKDYFFSVGDMKQPPTIHSIKAVFSLSSTKENIERRLGLIKQKIFQ